jgi:hypothetical protein
VAVAVAARAVIQEMVGMAVAVALPQVVLAITERAVLVAEAAAAVVITMVVVVVVSVFLGRAAMALGALEAMAPALVVVEEAAAQPELVVEYPLVEQTQQAVRMVAPVPEMVAVAPVAGMVQSEQSELSGPETLAHSHQLV